jgi:hypothetical protein
MRRQATEGFQLDRPAHPGFVEAAAVVTPFLGGLDEEVVLEAVLHQPQHLDPLPLESRAQLAGVVWRKPVPGPRLISRTATMLPSSSSLAARRARLVLLVGAACGPSGAPQPP